MKRSFLDPGTQVIPGTDPATLYVAMPGQYPGDVLRYTTFDRMHDTLPGGFSAAGPPRNVLPLELVDAHPPPDAVPLAVTAA